MAPPNGGAPEGKRDSELSRKAPPQIYALDGLPKEGWQKAGIGEYHTLRPQLPPSAHGRIELAHCVLGSLQVGKLVAHAAILRGC